MTGAPAESPSLSDPHARGSEEFGRVLAFSDGLFAIAMTLLVVGIAAPTLNDPDSVSELADRLGDLSQEIISFFISFAVIGRYWVAHHSFFGLLAAVDRGLIVLNLVYLAFVAFLPFPTALLGDFFDNPLSVSIYAMTIALVSGMEVVLYRHAYRRHLLTESISPEIFRWSVFESLAPVVLFLISVPVAFVSSIAAVACWFLNVPFGIVINRFRPPGAERYHGP